MSATNAATGETVTVIDVRTTELVIQVWDLYSGYHGEIVERAEWVLI